MMNPIFSRRYKGSRPNIMPTASKRHNYLKSMNSSGASFSDSSSGGSSGSASLASSVSFGESCEDPALGDKTPQRDAMVFTKPSRSKTHHGGGGSGQTDSASSSMLAQQLFSSRQNMLAQVSLTPQENHLRSKLPGNTGKGGGAHKREEKMKSSFMKQSFSTENFTEINGQNNGLMYRSPTFHDTITGDVTFRDFDFDDMIAEDKTTESYQAHNQSVPSSYYVSPVAVSNSRISRPNLNQRVSKETLDMKQWRELKNVVTGTGSFQDGWCGQGFTFDFNIPFGLVQRKGGPCGVLAVVQSLVIRNLLFGSPFSVESQNQKRKRLEQFTTQLCAGEEDGEGAVSVKNDRLDCLVDAIAEILWICGGGEQNKPEDTSTMIMFSDYRIQPEVICIKGRLELQQFIQNSIHRFDCIALVYSAVLTRGISRVKDDMDFENCSLIGLHGYCSQELINLLSIGQAISNAFDNDIELDGKVLKGIPARCDIGLLSLFEHYDSIKIGNFLKDPRFPVWIVCSESHFSVLFSPEKSLCTGDEDGNVENTSFDLFYFDGLSRQEKIIRLSIYIPPENRMTLDGTFPASRDNQFTELNNRGIAGREEDLIPPLEKCIRTKWKGARVDWNDTEPIL